MKIGQKLILGFMGIALFIGIVGYIGFNSNKRIDEYAYIVDMAHHAYEEIAKLEAIVLDQVHEGMHLLSFEEEACIELFKELGEDFRKQVEETKIAAAAAAAAPELREKFVAIEASHKKFETMFDKVVKAHYAGQLATREQRHGMHEVWCPVSDEVIELTRELQPLYTEMVEEAEKKSERVIVSTTRNIILVSIVGVLLALGLGLLIAKSITSPITKLKDAATEIGKGKLNTKVTIESKDEIGDLAASFRQMTEDLSKSRKELDQIYDGAPSGMRVVDRDLNIMSQNEAMGQLSGMSKEEAKGRKCYEQLKGAFCNTENCTLKQILKGEEKVDAEVEKESLEGRKIPCRVQATPFKDAAGNMIGIIEIFTDITETKRALTDLEEARDYTDNIIKNMIDTLIVVDPNAKIKTINKATSDLLDYKEDELIDKPVATIFAEEEEEEEEEEVTPFKGTRMKKLIEEGSIRDYEMTYKTKAGEKIPVSFSGSVMRDKEGELVGIVGIAHDMREIKRLMEKEKELAVVVAAAAAAAAAETDRKRAAELEKAYKELRETQAKLIQAGKMAAMGTLGAGIAHQLNQPLAGIRGFTQTVLMQIDKKNPVYEDLKKIEEQTGYMSEIITNIGGFARATEFKKVPIDINEPIEKSLQLLSEQLRLHGVKLTKDLDPNLPQVNADANQMQQVFVNFITNSREAFDDFPKEAKKEFIITSRCNDSKDSVEIIFSDTGPGISKDIIDRIFDPFFTTKGPKSTGLGLSLNYGMVQDHGGTIEVKSEAGKGATFVVRLPVVSEKLKAENAKS